MKRISKILSIMLVAICMLTTLPTMKASAASVTVTGGCTTRATAYSWGTYSTTNTITAVLPETENDFWVKYTLPSNKRVYARCSYSDQNEGMYIEMRNANHGILNQKYSPDDVLGVKADAFLCKGK